MSDPTTPQGFAARLTVGGRLSIDALAHDDLFPFEGDLRLKPLEPPTLPEPARKGEGGGPNCWNCSNPESNVLWSDERWVIRHAAEPTGLPLILVLMPRAHHDLVDLPDDLAAELGPMLRRVSRAMHRVPAVGRVHVNRWGDGSEHFHVWLLARPLGQWQMRGAMLAVWDDLLPKLPEEEWRANLRVVAEALTE